MIFFYSLTTNFSKKIDSDVTLNNELNMLYPTYLSKLSVPQWQNPQDSKCYTEDFVYSERLSITLSGRNFVKRFLFSVSFA